MASEKFQKASIFRILLDKFRRFLKDLQDINIICKSDEGNFTVVV